LQKNNNIVKILFAPIRQPSIMKEKITLDTLSKVMTTLVFAILISIAYFMIRDVSNNEIPIVAPILVVGFFVLTLGISWAYHPTSYEVTENGLLIHRPIGALTISKDEIVNIESIDPAKLRFGMRLFASGGFFGYFGLYSANSIGRYIRYTGHSKNLIMIETEKKRYVIGPDTEAFAQVVLKLG
jgi:hypothetical protein